MRVSLLVLLLIGASVDGLYHFNPVKTHTGSSLSNNSTAVDVDPELIFAHDQHLNELVVEDNETEPDEIKLERFLGEISESDEYGVSAITKKAIQTKKLISSLCYFFWIAEI